GKIRYQDRQLHDVVELAAGGLGDGAKIPEHLVGLGVDTFDEGAGGRIESELAGQVDRVTGAGTLRIGSESGRRVLRMDGFFRHGFLLLDNGKDAPAPIYAVHPIRL